MDSILELLQKDAKLSDVQLAEQTEHSAAEVRARINAWEEEGTIMGYQAVIDQSKAAAGEVTALIEVKVTPERAGGFDRIADRIARFDQVASCYLMSGGYDLAVLVQGRDLHEVARFVSEKLSSLEGVISTATHFQLKVYKQNGLLAKVSPEGKRLPISP
jgi:DNA-binding Lrp family transcriptional regulator